MLWYDRGMLKNIFFDCFISYLILKKLMKIDASINFVLRRLTLIDATKNVN